MKKGFIIKACLSVCLLLILIGALFAVILMSTKGTLFVEDTKAETEVFQGEKDAAFLNNLSADYTISNEDVIPLHKTNYGFFVAPSLKMNN